jgi:hypothetical protein
MRDLHCSRGGRSLFGVARPVRCVSTGGLLFSGYATTRRGRVLQEERFRRVGAD